MSCFRCGCPRPRDGGRQGSFKGEREQSYPGRLVNSAKGVSSSVQIHQLHFGGGYADSQYLDALLAAPARAPAALTAARRVAPFSAVVGLGMHDDGSSVHDACSNS